METTRRNICHYPAPCSCGCHVATAPSSDVVFNVTVPGHGTFSTNGAGLDRALGHYLPASPAMLRRAVAGATGTDAGYWSDVLDSSALLVILADANGWGVTV